MELKACIYDNIYDIIHIRQLENLKIVKPDGGGPVMT